MKLTFTYDIHKDIWCIKNYGKTSMNSATQTKVYEKLVAEFGDSPSDESINAFISSHCAEKHIDIKRCIAEYQKDWNAVADAYTTKAEKIFGISIQYPVTGYLTLNDRCPYSIPEKMFFVSLPTYSARRTSMHELWHFYTWEKFGSWEEKIGREKYNELKEALTVLLNVEYKDLLPDGVTDKGYPQHQELRTNIVEFWEKEKDIEKLWNHFVQQ